MNFSELGRMIEQLGKDRGIKKNVVVEAIEQAFLVTARKKYGLQGEYETKYNPDDGEVEIFQFKNVVDSVKDSILEISFNDAKNLDQDCEMGDQLGIKIENPNFSRVDVQTVKQIIFQKVRDAERETLFAEFKHRVGDLTTGIARRFEKGGVIVDLGKADAILHKREIIPGETFKAGDRIQAYLSEVVMGNKGPEIRLSRTSPLFLVKLFEMEVPEIQDGSIEIKSVAREPGQRAKVAVYTAERDVDPVGACVGMKGSRVQNIVNELQGEKIDIVKWNGEIEVFAKAALAPSEITSIMLNNEDQSMDVIVEDDQLSLAIGRRGQNVRLAAMLTGWKINIISKSKLQEKISRSIINLKQIEGLSDTWAQGLVHNGIMSISDLSAMDPHEMGRKLGVGQEEANKLIAKVNAAIETGTVKLVPDVGEDIISASAVPGQAREVQKQIESGQPKTAEVAKDKFSDTEKRLREELAAFKIK